MKKHNLLKYIMIAILVTVVLTWVLPITYFDLNYGLIEEERDAVGIFSLMNYIIIALNYFVRIGLYVLAVGGLYGILHKISGYRNLIDKVTKGFKGREWLFMAIVMLVFALLSAVAGLSLPIMVLFPFVISVILAMGYDKITAAMVTAGSTILGLVGSAFNAQNTYGIDYVLGTTPNGYVVYKLILLFVVLAFLFVNVIIYGKKHRDTKKIEEDYIPEASTAKKEKTWQIVVVMDLLLLILILAFFTWTVFDITWFEDIFTSINEHKIFGFPLIGSLLGLDYPFGNWTIVEATVLVLIAGWLISFMYRMKFNDYITNFINGAKRALKPAALVVLLYTVLVIITYVPVLDTMFKPILGLTSGLNVLTMSVVAFISNAFSVESYYAATGVLPYIVNVSYTNLVQSDLTVLSLIWQSMYGAAMFVAPTSVVLMATLSYLHIPYGKWLKAVWISLLGIVAIPVVIFVMSMII